MSEKVPCGFRGEIALLYSLVAVAPELGSSKFRMTSECPGPKAKAGGAGTAGMASRGSSGAGRTGGAAVAVAWAGGAACPWSMLVLHDEHLSSCYDDGYSLSA